MTTEEKAKSYDKALERAKEWMNEREQMIYPREIVESVFPELTESEDDRIEKSLINELKINASLRDEINRCGWNPDRLVAYLEKQKEQKDYRKLYEDIAKSEWFKKNYVGKSLGENPYDFAMSQQEKQKGLRKKPKFKVGDRIRTLEKDDEGVGPMYEDEIVSIGDDGSYKLKHLGELCLPESEWELVEKYRTEEKKEQKPTECDKETDIQKAFREGQNAGRQEVFDNPWAYGLENIDNVFGFRIGDRVRLVDGDGRPHIIKMFVKIEGLHGPDFYRVVFEDNTASDHIIPGSEYPNGYFTCIEKIDTEKERKPGITEDNPIDPFDTKLFQDGVKEGRRLEREDMLKERIC